MRSLKVNRLRLDLLQLLCMVCNTVRSKNRCKIWPRDQKRRPRQRKPNPAKESEMNQLTLQHNINHYAHHHIAHEHENNLDTIDKISTYPRCLKITEKVSFNIASEASYVYILSGQKLIENAKNGQFWRVFRKPEVCGQTVLPDRSVLIGKKLVENAKIQKFKCDILSNFQTLCIFTNFIMNCFARVFLKVY